jgi:hypothetical protein
MILSHYMSLLCYLVSDTTYRLNRQYSGQHLHLCPARCTWHPALRLKADLGITPPEEGLYILSRRMARVFVHPAVTLGRRFRRLRIRKSLQRKSLLYWFPAGCTPGGPMGWGKLNKVVRPLFASTPALNTPGLGDGVLPSHRSRSDMAG